MVERNETYDSRIINGILIKNKDDLVSMSNCFINSAILLYNDTENIDAIDQQEISDHIIVGGCRYAVCYGYECSSWDDSIDYAYLKKCNFEPKDEDLVITTWHNDENIEDVLHFFLENTNFDNWKPEKYIILVIGNNSKTLDEIFLKISKERIQ